MDEERDHGWCKGDLCLYWAGNVMRVVQIKPPVPGAKPSSKQRFTRLKIEQAFGLFETFGKCKPVVVFAHRCRRIDLVALGTEYINFGNFIKEQARKGGAEI